MFAALGYELQKGVSWLDVTPGVARYLWQRGQEYAKRDGKQCYKFGFMLGAESSRLRGAGKFPA